MARVNLKSKRTWKKIGTIVLSVVLALGSVVGIFTLVTKLEEQTHKTIRPMFHVGELNESTGKYVLNSNKSIYSDLFECQGLEITPNFESNVDYRVFYYDTDKEFLLSSNKTSDAYKLDSLYVTYARIEITPKEDSKVSWYEVLKYSKQLKIIVNKEQLNIYDAVLNGVTGNKIVCVGAKFNPESLSKYEDDEYTESYWCNQRLEDVTNYSYMYVLGDAPYLHFNYEELHDDDYNTFNIYRCSKTECLGINDIEHKYVYNDGEFAVIRFNLKDVSYVQFNLYRENFTKFKIRFM